ncbi:septum formation family protein [Streptomyces sp. NBC_00654]|uniref:DUF4190 domain-containing protein n=1 Tax=Streptomyces sp. NBC_00654 TaxID=2975799 RepID=UPI00224D6F0C|nr:DUF4190 domain-containing protein [Streptomyces sp. NBC_00654]MCX4964475.1 septum formation family protein [Streptomyces sp. NBC_00654]
MSQQPPPSYPRPPSPQGPYGSWQQPVPQQPLSGLAVTSLVLSLLVCLAPLGLIAGIVALVRIPRNGRRGKGLAVAGVVVGAVVTALAAFLTVIGGVRFYAWESEGGSTRGAGRSGSAPGFSVYDLEEGDCFTPGAGLPTVDGQSIADISAELIPCGSAHRAEVYGTFRLQIDSAFPGAAAIGEAAREGCAPLLADFAPDPLTLPRVRTFFYFPQMDRWDSGDRTVLCWVADASGVLDTSVRQDRSGWDAAQLAYLDALRPADIARFGMPPQGPDSDFAAAKSWSGRAADSHAESARLLRAAALPESARRPVAALADGFEASAAAMRRASTAPTVDAFKERLALTRSTVTPEKEAAARQALGLELPGGSGLSA